MVPFAQGGVGIGFGSSDYVHLDGDVKTEDREWHVGWQLGVAAGAALMPWRRFGFFGQLSFTVAPVVSNLLGDRHDSGGGAFVIGLRSAL
jgi:hypothetical protein